MALISVSYVIHTHTQRFTHAQTNTEHTVSKSKQRTHTLICFSFIFYFVGFFSSSALYFSFFLCAFHSELCFCAIWITHSHHTYKLPWKERQKNDEKERIKYVYACMPARFVSFLFGRHNILELLQCWFYQLLAWISVTYTSKKNPPC